MHITEVFNIQLHVSKILLPEIRFFRVDQQDPENRTASEKHITSTLISILTQTIGIVAGL